ncbi:Eukaryotic peptide chain release factor GTP-binding subunit ERF3A [Amphibalanus amphitrite]|uniref:Eukaryotic peptide chain release factor GTP-binding subunit ERF3A n=1 Tax=Amphibalanus amphitrite TaxID=1232801 RepID=A0A6A4WCV7_AMPAM|nr:eukaryotic peptide chain release factor GTP-binding subunit ERF3A-like [Amphibalanus amphitrite]KAF0303049.1 Eukaryotic peptide chain release factor GTP-binding subunit ERF3A [Amphibalanus amphitrite]
MEQSTSEVEQNLSKLNVNAAEFVPSWATPAAPDPPPPEDGAGRVESSPSASAATTPGDEASGQQSSAGDGPVDNWEEADTTSEAVTPNEEDDGEDDDEEDGSESKDLKPRKKKVRQASEREKTKEHVNMVFIGHVDAGKSTIGGQIMYLTGMVDKRTLEKYEKEAKEKNRETWYLSWALDTNLEERDKGKTVEVGRAYFETEKKHFTILDAPGHKSFVPNMIGGASQADLAVLVISARKGEFETGFDRGGQTREHAMLVKTAGVKHLVVLVNKMDDHTVNWSEQRYNECKDKLMPYLKKCGFNPKTDVAMMPCSGLTGAGLKEPVDPAVAPWYSGQPFIDYIDSLPSMKHNPDGPFLMPIVDKYSDRGTIVLGKVESGTCKKGQTLLLMPNRTSVQVDALWSDDEEVTSVIGGENVKIRLKGVDENDISSGFVMCDPSQPVPTGRVFDAQVAILEHKSIICAGYSAICHLHSCVEEITVKALLCMVDKRTGEKSKTRPRFVKQDQVVIMRLESSGPICLDVFKKFPQLGRFTLRDEGKTIAIGKVLKIIE